MNLQLKLRGRGEIYFLRHGQTEGAKRGLMKGLGEQPLSPEGVAQAERTGDWLATRGIERVFSSPLRRAMQTAHIVSGRLHGEPAVTCLNSLRELDTGTFTGLTQAEAAARLPEAFSAFQKRSWDGVPGAEKSDALYARAAAVWRELASLTASGSGRLLCVSHKGILQWIISHPFASRSWMPLFEIDFCGIYRLSFDVSDERNYFIWDIMNLVAWR
ncbi:MAG: histidine phosphatase family protein [Spirochaetales bacterium]|nr:histidine phosphatase family protein [Spirochaetales bacterium]